MEWKRMPRSPWNASEYPATPEGKKAVRNAVKVLSHHKECEYRWNAIEEAFLGEVREKYIIEWRRNETTTMD